MKYPVLAKIATNLIPFAMGSYATGLHKYVGVQSFVGGNVVRYRVGGKIAVICCPCLSIQISRDIVDTRMSH